MKERLRRVYADAVRQAKPLREPVKHRKWKLTAGKKRAKRTVAQIKSLRKESRE